MRQRKERGVRDDANYKGLHHIEGVYFPPKKKKKDVAAPQKRRKETVTGTVIAQTWHSAGGDPFAQEKDHVLVGKEKNITLSRWDWATPAISVRKGTASHSNPKKKEKRLAKLRKKDVRRARR